MKKKFILFILMAYLTTGILMAVPGLVIDTSELSQQFYPAYMPLHFWIDKPFIILKSLGDDLITGYVANILDEDGAIIRTEAGFIKNNAADTFGNPMVVLENNNEELQEILERPIVGGTIERRILLRLFLIYNKNLGARVENYKDAFLNYERIEGRIPASSLITRSFSKEPRKSYDLVMNVFDPDAMTIAEY